MPRRRPGSAFSGPAPHALGEKRANWLLTTFGVLIALLVIRTFGIQVIKRPYYMGIDSWLHPGEKPPPPKPGTIYASGDEPLAESVQMLSLCANPRKVEEKEGLRCTAREISDKLGLDYDEMYNKLKRGLKAKKRFIYLKRLLPPERGEKVSELTLSKDCVWGEREYRRIYPGGSLACHVLGRCSPFHEPKDGMELRWSFLLSGQPGTWRKNVDRDGRIIPGEDGDRVLPPVPGKDIKLTLDRSLQRAVEMALDDCVKKHRPQSATCVVLDPDTGAVLALASRPSFDPNQPGRCTTQSLKDLPVLRQYEPGSLFKVLLVAAVLDSGRYTPDMKFFCGGTTVIGGKPLSCWDRWAYNGGHGWLHLDGMLAESCNLVAAQFALWLGAKDYCRFLRRVGIGEKTQIGLPGEAAGSLHEAKDLMARDLANLGFGQGVSVTDIQMVTAIAAVVNGGRLMQPYIVRQVLDSSDGTVLREAKPVVRRRVCSEETSAQVRRMMGKVVEQGTGTNAQIKGVQVGGKTGTAQQWNAEAGNYEDGRTIVSFILVTPLDHPRFVILFTAEEPQIGRHGSQVAAPYAREVALAALREAGLLPEDVEISTGPGASAPDR